MLSQCRRISTVKHVAATGGVAHRQLERGAMRRRDRAVHIPAPFRTRRHDDGGSVVPPQLWYGAGGRRLPGDAQREILRQDQMIDESQQFIKTRRMIVFQIRHYRNACLAGDPRRTDHAGHAVVVDVQHARLADQLRRR